MKNVQKHFQNFSADSKSEDSFSTHSQILPILFFLGGGEMGELYKVGGNMTVAFVKSRPNCQQTAATQDCLLGV